MSCAKTAKLIKMLLGMLSPGNMEKSLALVWPVATYGCESWTLIRL